MKFIQNYLQSNQFKTTSRNASEDITKKLFNAGAWAVIGFFNFLKDMVKMAFGTRH